MLFFILQLSYLLIFSTIISSFISNWLLRILNSLFFSSFILMELFSIYMGGSLIDLKFYLHFNIEQSLSLISLFKKEVTILILCFLATTVFSFFVGIILRKRKLIVMKLIIIIVSTILMYTENGILFNAYDIFKIVYSREIVFEESLTELGIDQNDYITPHNITSSKGKNIIIISLESLEKEFFNEKLIHLVPNLDSIRKKYNFYNMLQVPGGGWTSASLYTYLTGFPAFFKDDGNTIFNTAFDTKITGISHVLKNANYDLTYFMANPKFSGTLDLLTTYQIDVKSGLNIEGDFEKNEWGIFDKDLFEAAKKHIKLRKNFNTPFAVMISTMSTHPPDGIYDSRFEKIISPQRSKLEFQVKATDYLINDLLLFLEKENLIENTVFYIFPDHLMLGNTFEVLKDFNKDRELYLITNANVKDTKYSLNEKIYQIDLPKIILNGAQVKNNATFFTDYIKQDKINFIKNKQEIITSLNHSALIRDKALRDSAIYNNDNKKYSNFRVDTNRFIAHAGGGIDKKSYTNSFEALENSYSKGFRLLELDIIETSDGQYVAAHDWSHWKEITNYIGNIPPNLKEFKKTKILNQYTPLDLNDINKWFTKHPDAILVTDKINQPKKFSEKFIDKNRLMMELFTMDAVIEGISCGILSSMPSENVINELPENEKLKTLKSLHIKHVAVSHKSIIPNKEFYLSLKSNGIKTFVFHVNHDEGMDENYVIQNEIDFIFGMYADFWEF